MESIAHNLRRGVPWVLVPFGLAVAVRLALEPGYFTFPFAVLVGLLTAFGAAHLWLVRKPGPWRIRGGVLVNFLGVNIGYEAIGYAMNSHAGWRADNLVYAVDRTIFRGDPQRFIARLSTPWLSTVTTLGYLAFGALLLYLFLSEAFALGDATGRVQLGLMRLYGLGFSGYVLLPAAGPAINHPQLLPPIHQSTLSAAVQPWILRQCSHVDVCPSIHAAVCAFILIWTYQRRRWLFWCLLPVGAALLLGTVYLQFHYFIDLPFGLALGAWAALSVSHVKPRPTLLQTAGSPG